MNLDELLRPLTEDECPLFAQRGGKSLSQLSTHVYSLPVDALSWFFVLTERQEIKVIHDVRPHADGVSVVLEFPHYSTWLNFRDITRPKGVKWLDAWTTPYSSD